MITIDGRPIVVADSQIHLWRDEGPDSHWRPEWRTYALTEPGGLSPAELADVLGPGLNRWLGWTDGSGNR